MKNSGVNVYLYNKYNVVFQRLYRAKKKQKIQKRTEEKTRNDT